MARYIAKKSNTILGLGSNAILERAFSSGWDILRRDEHGETLIAHEGKWLEPKPNLEQTGEYDPGPASDLTAQVQKIGAGLDYVAMMTGVEL